MIDRPTPPRATDGDAHGALRPGLTDAALVVLAQEVISRLARWAQEAIGRRGRSDFVEVEPDIEALCRALIGLDAGAAREMIMMAHAQGATHEDLCLYHMGEAARRLGELWEEDWISYRHVTLAAGRVLNLLRDLRDLAPPFEPRGGRCALFATVPGEMHVVGPTMAADMFREDGWEVDIRLDLTEEMLAETVRAGGYPIVGLTAATTDRVRSLARTVVTLRVAVPKILIFVGGNIARLEPDIAMLVGADASGFDMTSCRAEMERLHQMQPGLLRPN